MSLKVLALFCFFLLLAGGAYAAVITGLDATDAKMNTAPTTVTVECALTSGGEVVTLTVYNAKDDTLVNNGIVNCNNQTDILMTTEGTHYVVANLGASSSVAYFTVRKELPKFLIPDTHPLLAMLVVLSVLAAVSLSKK